MTKASPMKSRPSDDTLMLLRAVDAGDAERVRSLLAAGADANATSKSNETALMRAVSKGHLEVVQVLLDAGGDVHARSENGFTPLFMAVFFGHADIVRLLLARGSDPAAPTRANKTAEEWARSRGSAEIVEILNETSAARARKLTAHVASTDVASAGDEQAPAPHPFFPADGQFRPVDPLSEIGTTAAAVIDNAPTPEAAVAADNAPRRNGRVEVARHAPDERFEEHEETTLVPTRRASRALPPRPRRAVWQSWPVTAAALVMSVFAGLFAGSYLLGARQSVETSQQPAPPSPSATEPANKAATELVNESASTPTAPAVVAGEADAKAEKPNRVEVTTKTAQPDTDTERRAHELEPPARRVVIAEAHLERPAQTSGRSVDRSNTNKPAQRDTHETAAALPRARPTQERPPAPVPAQHTLPVSSPPPSAKSKKVIQWP